MGIDETETSLENITNQISQISRDLEKLSELSVYMLDMSNRQSEFETRLSTLERQVKDTHDSALKYVGQVSKNLDERLSRIENK